MYEKRKIGRISEADRKGQKISTEIILPVAVTSKS